MKKRISFMWDVETIKKLKQISKAENRSANNYLENLILKEDGKATSKPG